MLVGFLEEKRWEIFNERMRGDEEGEYTFTGEVGEMVVNYIIGSKEVRETVRMREIK